MVPLIVATFHDVLVLKNVVFFFKKKYFIYGMSLNQKISPQVTIVDFQLPGQEWKNPDPYLLTYRFYPPSHSLL